MTNAYIVSSSNYRLRLLEPTDAGDEYLSWLNDPEVTKYLEVRHYPQTIESLQSFVAGHDNVNSFLFGIFTLEHRHVGNYSLRIDRPNSLGTLGVMIGDRQHWGRNIVQETRAALLNHCFDSLRLHKVCGACHATNLPAVYNYRRQGWSSEGVRREHALGWDGRRVDVVMFGMLAEDWKTRRLADEARNV